MAENQDRDQRTEEATPQRIRKAREEGQIGFSAEFTGGILLATAIGLAWGWGQLFFGGICQVITGRISDFEQVVVDPRMLTAAAIDDFQSLGVVCLGLMFPVAVVTLFGGLMQTGFNVSLKPLQLDFNKLSIKSGIGRIFSSKSLVRGALSIAKASIILAIVYLIIQSKMEQIALSSYGSFHGLMAFLCDVLLYASVGVAAMLMIVGLIDLAYQKWKHLQDLKMSLQDIKDEHKETEGDPMLKARMRKLQSEMSRERMMSDVPKATVVVTNPTHFAVAIQYDRETMEAPIVIAKGADHLAKRIIQIAKDNDVAVVERKPVARFLYANVDVGVTIPFQLYQAVAEILNFVNQVKRAS